MFAYASPIEDARVFAPVSGLAFSGGPVGDALLCALGGRDHVNDLAVQRMGVEVGAD